MKFSANDFQSEFNTSIQAWQQLSLVWEPLKVGLEIPLLGAALTLGFSCGN